MIFGESNMGALGNPGTKWMVYMEQIKQNEKITNNNKDRNTSYHFNITA